jgi:hypothetical protein
MSDPVARIRRLAALAAARGALGDDGEWLAATLNRWISGEAWDAACDLAPGWRREIARGKRDEAICALSDLACPGGSPTEQADAVRRELRRYEPLWRRRDQHRTAPAGSDQATHLLFAIFSAGASLKGDSPRVDLAPDSPSQLKRILLSACAD